MSSTPKNQSKRQSKSMLENRPACAAAEAAAVNDFIVDVGETESVDETLLTTPATEDEIAALDMSNETALGTMQQSVAYSQAAERGYADVLHAGAYRALWNEDLSFWQLMLRESETVDARRGIVRAIGILAGGVRRDANGTWFIDDSKCLISIDKHGAIAWRDRHRDGLQAVRQRYAERWYGRSLKTLNSLVREEKPKLTAKAVRQHISRVEKSEFSDADRAFLVGYMSAVQAFMKEWERKSNALNSVPTANSGLNGKPCIKSA